MTEKDKSAADKAADRQAAEQDRRAASEPDPPPGAREHPLADPGGPQGFTEAVVDPHVQGSTDLPKTPEDLEDRANEGVPSVQKGAPEQVAENKLAATTGGAGEPYVGHGDDQPGGQDDPMKGKK